MTGLPRHLLGLDFPPAPARGETVSVAAVFGPGGEGGVDLLVHHLPPGPDDHGLRWAVWERREHGGAIALTTLPMPYPSYEAARDAAHDRAVRLVRERALAERAE